MWEESHIIANCVTFVYSRPFPRPVHSGHIFPLHPPLTNLFQQTQIPNAHRWGPPRRAHSVWEAKLIRTHAWHTWHCSGRTVNGIHSGMMCTWHGVDSKCLYSLVSKVDVHTKCCPYGTISTSTLHPRCNWRPSNPKTYVSCLCCIHLLFQEHHLMDTAGLATLIHNALIGQYTFHPTASLRICIILPFLWGAR